MLPTGPGEFSPNGKVNRAEIAYSLVQTLGLEEFAINLNGQIPVVTLGDKTYTLDDADEIPAGLEGYVSIALNLNLIDAFFTMKEGQSDPEILSARFRPMEDVTRAKFAVIITRTFALFTSGEEKTLGTSEVDLALSSGVNYPLSYPNPFSMTTTIEYFVKQDGLVKVVLYDMQGRQLQTLIQQNLKSGIHSIQFDGQNLTSGTYIYVVQSGNESFSKRIILKK
jgi:serine protease AprX